LEQRTEPILQTKLEQITDVSLYPSCNKMCFASHNKNVYIVDPQSVTEVDILRGHGKGVTSCHWNPVYNVIISGSEDETIRVWDASKKEELFSL